MTSPRTRLKISLGLAAIALAVALGAWWQVLAGQRVLIGGDLLYGCCYPWAGVPGSHQVRNLTAGDQIAEFTPWATSVAEALRDGHLPVWDSHAMSGRPLLANAQSSVFSPFTLVASAFPAARGLSLAMLLKILVAGAGMFAFLRACGTRSPPAVIGAVGYASSSFLIVWLGWYQSTVAAVLPLTFAAAEWWLRKRAPLALPAFAAATWLQLVAGNPEASVHLAFGLGLYLVIRAAAGGRQTLWLIGGLAGAAVAGALLAAPQVLPFLFELRRTSAFHAGARSQAGLNHLAVREAVTWLVPNSKGNPGFDGRYGWSPNYNEATGFAGVWSLVAAPLALRRRGAAGRGPALALAGVIAVVAVTVYGPLIQVVGRLPLLSLANNGRLLILLCFAVPAAAGLGLDSLLDRRRRFDGGWILAGAGAVLLAALIALAVDVGRLGPRVDALLPPIHNLIGFWVVVGALSLAAALAFTGAGLLGGRTPAILGLGLCAIVEGALFAIPFNPLVPPEQVPPATAVTTWLQSHRGDGYVAAAGNVLVPETATLYGLRDVRGYDVLIDDRLRLYWSAADPGYTDAAFTTTLARPGSSWLAAAGVRYFLTNGPALPGTVTRLGADGVVVAEVPGSRPFAFIAPATVSAGDMTDAARELARDPLGPVVVEGGCCTAPAAPGDAVTGVTRGEGDVRLDVEVSQAATLVLLQSYAEGWSARVDGRPVPVQPADVHFQAVRVPAGAHRVELTYTPPALALGELLAPVGLLLAVLLGVGAARYPKLAPQRRTKSLTA